MSAPSLKEFVSQLKSRNISRPNLFNVQITPPAPLIGKVDVDLTSMWCHGAQTPHMFLHTQDNFIEAGVRRKYAYDVDFQNLVLNFYVDQDFRVKQFFDAWKHLTVPYNRQFNYPNEYTADSLVLFILNQEDKQTYKYEYSRVYPKTVNSIELSFANGNTFNTLNVEFVFEDVFYTALTNSSNGDITTSKPESSIVSLRSGGNVEINKSLNQNETVTP